MDVILATTSGSLKLRAVGDQKWALDDPHFDKRGRLTSFNKGGGLTDSTSLFDYLVSEGVVRSRCVTHMLLEQCAFMGVYGSAVTTMVYKRFFGPTPLGLVPGLEHPAKFQMDRRPDISEFAGDDGD